MVEIRKAIPVKEAINRIMGNITPMKVETVQLAEAYGRILAEPIIALHPVPPFNRSPYDGYAIRSCDSHNASEENPAAFTVVDEIGAGSISSVTLAQGEAVRIMTGAQLPVGADAVVMFEQTVSADQIFTIGKPFEPNQNVTLIGEDVEKGEVLINPGAFIHPGTIALLATFGYINVQVAKKPVVGILSTGTELLDVGDELTPGKIRNSNGPMIIAQLDRMGIESQSYGMEADNFDACRETVARAMAETDCLITTGGVSVGDFDYLPQIYHSLGARVLFNKVAMRPGSVTTVAVANNKLLFGLSGNPSACFTGFELFARPALLKMMGAAKPYIPYTKAILGEAFLEENPFTRFVRAVYDATPSGVTIVSTGFNHSSSVSSIAGGNAFLVLPSGTKGYKSGEEVDVLLLGITEGIENWHL